MKKDRHVLGLAIQFNLTKINQWLADGGKNDALSTMDRKWDFSKEIIKDYYIDVLPNGSHGDMYFHRQPGVITSTIEGIEYFEHASGDFKAFIDQSNIHRLGWNFWTGHLVLEVELRKIVLCVPLAEFLLLQEVGEIKDLSLRGREDRRLSVPVSFKSATSNEPDETIEVWRHSSCPETVIYRNALASVGCSSLGLGVEY